MKNLFFIKNQRRTAAATEGGGGRVQKGGEWAREEASVANADKTPETTPQKTRPPPKRTCAKKHYLYLDIIMLDDTVIIIK